MLQVGQKVEVDREPSFYRVHDNNKIQTSVKEIFATTFTVRGFSKYLFKIATMESTGISKLKVKII